MRNQWHRGNCSFCNPYKSDSTTHSFIHGIIAELAVLHKLIFIDRDYFATPNVSIFVSLVHLLKFN